MKTPDLKTPKKLVVKRSTLRDLSPSQTRLVMGGATNVVSTKGTCGTHGFIGPHP